MATSLAQRRWRSKYRLVKSQLNVMAVRQTHEALALTAEQFDLAGKAEAVAFAAYVLRALMQRAEYAPDARAILDDAAASYRENREQFCP